MTFRPKKIKTIEIKNSLDSDRDGVPDFKDCRPFNPWKQHDDWINNVKEKKPLLHGEEIDWLSTKRYKRRPRLEHTSKSKLTRKLIIDNVEERYRRPIDTIGEIVIEGIDHYLVGKRPGFPDPTLKDVRVYPYHKNTFVLYDNNKDVYHYVFAENIFSEVPTHLLSITGDDKRRIKREIEVKNFFRWDE